MAILKHIASKNADYRAAFNYLVYQHDEFTQKPILDDAGRPVLRSEYYLDGLLCHPLEFARACKKTNERFHKNEKKSEIKSHHYILSFDPRDRDENGLTGEEAQRMGMEFAAANFPGHQAIICTHTDGHNSSGNIHVHIVINSVRAEDVKRQDFMERPCDSRAGNKHHLTNDYLSHLKQQVMTMCQNRQLYQVDLLNPALANITEQEYWASRRGQDNLNKRNAEITEAGLKPRTTKFETQKEQLRQIISSAAERSHSFEDFQKLLSEEHSISVRDKRGRYSYTLPDREKPITGRALGTAFDRDHLLSQFAENAKGHREQPAPKIEVPLSPTAKKAPDKPATRIITTTKVRLIVDLENCIKAQKSQAYAQKVKITNLKQMAQTLAYVQEHDYGSLEEVEQAFEALKSKTSNARNDLKATEAKLAEVNKQIRLTGQYFANKAIYAEYRKSKKSPKFYEEHRAEIALYESARDSLQEISGGEKLPSMKVLREEKDKLTAAKNTQYEAFQTARIEQREMQTIYTNIQQMLGIEPERTNIQEHEKAPL